VEDGVVSVDYMPTAEMAADYLTKPLKRAQFEANLGALGLKEGWTSREVGMLRIGRASVPVRMLVVNLRPIRRALGNRKSFGLTGGPLGRLEVPKIDLRGARLNRIFRSIYSQSLPS
jgi:hypothetical protein